jgi:hypothetical protein
MKKPHYSLYLMSALTALFNQVCAQATEFQPVGKALQTVLGSSKVFKKNFGAGNDVFYTKDGAGKPLKLAFVEHGTYPPNCTHTWVIGVDAATDKVSHIEVVEMGCPHAFPTRTASYLDQYTGKGPADAKTLVTQIDTIAKATGSCNLTSDAVARSITNAVKHKKEL